MKTLRNKSLLAICPILLSAAPGLSPAQSTQASIYVDAAKVENQISPYLYGACIEDVNHEIYGGLYAQKIFGESFEEPNNLQGLSRFSKYEGVWFVQDNIVSISASRGGKIIYNEADFGNGVMEVDLRMKNDRGNMTGIAFRVSDAAIGLNNFNGYSVSFANTGKTIVIGKHRSNKFEMLKELNYDFDPYQWNRVKVAMKNNAFDVFLNGKNIFTYTDTKNPILSGKVGLRNQVADADYRNLTIQPIGEKTEKVSLQTAGGLSVSCMWDAIVPNDGRATFKQDGKNAFHGKFSQAIEWTDGKGIAGVANKGLNRWGISVAQGQTFSGRLHLRTDGLQGNVTVALQSADGSKEYASQKIKEVSKEWAKREFNLTSTVTDKKARFAVYLDQPGKVWIDQVTLLPTGKDLYKGLPLRNDIAQAMVDQGLTFLRYGGTMVNVPGYRFKNMIGDRDKRPQYNGHWYAHSTNGFGIEEFLQFCEAARFQSAFAVSIDETPEDMADMVEYLNGPVTSEWGKKRAENGHPQPYNVKYIGIGNEEVIRNSAEPAYRNYIERFKLLHDAMKSKDPNLNLVISVEWKPQLAEWMEMVFQALKNKAAYWDYHPVADPLTTGATVDAKLSEMKSLFHQWDPTSTLKCVIFEENGNTHNMRRVLGHTTLQNAVRRHGDFVLGSCAANALQPYRQNDNSWDQGQVFFTPSQVWGMPPYYAQQMASNYHQPLLVHSVADKKLDVTATRSENSDCLVLHITNIHPEAVKSDIDVSSFGTVQSVKAISLSGKLNEINTPDQPKKIAPVETILSPENKQTFKFAPNSYTILVYTK